MMIFLMRVSLAEEKEGKRRMIKIIHINKFFKDFIYSDLWLV